MSGVDSDLIVSVFRKELSGDYRGALELSAPSVDDDELLCYLAAVCHIKLGQLNEAAGLARKLYMSGSSPQMRFYGALFLFELREFDAATECLLELRGNPATPEPLKEEIEVVLSSLKNGGWTRSSG